jgi:hypothetical protein
MGAAAMQRKRTGKTPLNEKEPDMEDNDPPSGLAENAHFIS